MALVRNIVIVVIAIAFWNRFVRQRTTDAKEKLLQSYDYIIGKYLFDIFAPVCYTSITTWYNYHKIKYIT